MDFLTSGFNIVLIILGFGMLIFIHELGHFVAAKWAGIRTEAFAVGMGPVMLSWRKGIGVRIGSTARDVESRVREYFKSSGISGDLQGGDEVMRQQHINRAMDALGIGETEYSLRWLPIGGFVKMLGQEDANPNYVSDDPRSYNRCPIGKRMIVVSAGVVMNLLLAIVLFIVAFMVGVKFEAPVVGDVATVSPAGSTNADNAVALGITEAGLQPGDRVIAIDDEPAQTFADLQIASAMSKPGVPVRLTVEREGVREPLQFTLNPQKDATSGLLSIGVTPASSTTLLDQDQDDIVAKSLQRTGLSKAGVELGMRMTHANREPVQTFEQFQAQVRASAGKPVATQWTRMNDDDQTTGEMIRADIAVQPSFMTMLYPPQQSDELQNYEWGLFGLTPLVRLEEVAPGPNAEVLKEGDVVLRVNTIQAPRMADFRREIQRNRGGTVNLKLLRDGKEIDAVAAVDKSKVGRINVVTSNAWELPFIAEPMAKVRKDLKADADASAVSTPVAELGLMGRTRLEAVGDAAISNWSEFRDQLRLQTAKAHASGEGAVVELHVTVPTPGRERETKRLALSAEQVADLHKLSWHTALPSFAFEHLYTLRSAQGSPARAVSMGFEETRKLVVMTYLTIDRLFRRSVGVDQLRGPVGIVHIGTKVADRGFMYLIFFLAMISVNLAVINFLPLPIVDGGLFLFLVYEKFKGKPPSLAFQNVATVIGLGLIITMFVVVTWNDFLRLLS